MNIELCIYVNESFLLNEKIVSRSSYTKVWFNHYTKWIFNPKTKNENYQFNWLISCKKPHMLTATIHYLLTIAIAFFNAIEITIVVTTFFNIFSFELFNCKARFSSIFFLLIPRIIDNIW